MDLIDKIQLIQSYSSLPFGELYEDSVYIGEVAFLSIDDGHVFDLDVLGIKKQYFFKFETSYNKISNLKEHKRNIIIKIGNQYVLFKNVISSTFTRQYDTYYASYFDSSQRMFNNTVEVTGYATGILKEYVI